MKKLVVILTVLFCWQGNLVCGNTDGKNEETAESVEVFNKYDQQGKYRFGVKVNTGFSFIQGRESTGNPGMGFDAGFTIDRFIGGKSIALNSGLSFSNYKMSHTVCNDSETQEAIAPENCIYTRNEFKGSVVNIPLNLKIRSDVLGQKTKIYGLAGVNAALAVNGGKKMATPVSSTGIVLSQGKMSDLNNNNMDLLLNFGGGIEFNTGRLRTIAVGVNYQRGLNDFTTVDGSMKRDNLYASVEFLF